jgi:hypothetical protein
MNLTLKNLPLKKVNAPYSIGYIDNFLTKEYCEKLYREIELFKDYDDLVMNGRMRVNKGSNKFKNYLESSPNLNFLYDNLNNKNFYLEMENKLKTLNQSKWKPIIKNFNYSKTNYGEQNFNLIKLLRKSWLISKLFKKAINLDIDFSRSKKGYYRKAHRDRDTRIISFLIYLNTIDPKLGGEFEVFKLNKEEKEIKNLKRFPNEAEVSLVDKFSPKSGQLFLFQSSPNSYHGVSKFTSENQDRVFIYGSYSLDRKVDWKSNF